MSEESTAKLIDEFARHVAQHMKNEGVSVGDKIKALDSLTEYLKATKSKNANGEGSGTFDDLREQIRSVDEPTRQ